MIVLLLIDCKSGVIRRFSGEGKPIKATLPETQDTFLPADLEAFRVLGLQAIPKVEEITAAPAPKGVA